MEEKTRLNTTPFPLQTIFGEKITNSKGDSKFSRRLPLKSKTLTFPSERNTRKEETRYVQQRRMSRKVIRDSRTGSPAHSLPMSRDFSATFSGSMHSSNYDTYGFVPQELISTTQGFLHTVLHQPRLSTIDRELIIISLEGVIANYSNRELSIRRDSLFMLKELHLRYQVVIVSGWKLARLLKIMSYLSNKGVYLSAAYKQVSHGRGISEEFETKRHEWYLDYSRIYKDFNISTENVKKVVSVVPLLCEPEELLPPHYIVQHTGALRPLFLVSKAPVPTAQHPFIPLSLLVPHIAASSVSLSLVSECIKSLATSKNFFSGANNLKNPNFQLHVTNVLNKQIISLYKKTFHTEVPQSFYLILKSSSFSDIITLHKEKDIQNLGYTNLLEFTLNINN